MEQDLTTCFRVEGQGPTRQKWTMGELKILAKTSGGWFYQKSYRSFCHLAIVENQSYHFGIGAPPILEPFLVGIGMFTGGTGFDPWPFEP